MNRSTMILAGLAFVLATGPAFAQGRSSGGGGRGGGGQGSAGGGSTFGSSGTDISSGFGNQAFGNTDSFGQSSGMNALTSGMSGSATGLGRATASGSGSSTGSRTNASGGTSRTGVRSNSAQGRNSAAGMSGQRSPGRGGMAGMSGMNGMNFGGGMNGMGRGGLSNRGIGVQQYVRPMITVNMEAPPALAPAFVAQAANATFAQSRGFVGLQGTNVNVGSNGVAILSGRAATNHDRVIAAAMLAMEPGVRIVQNEIVVSGPSSTTTLPPFASPPSNR